MNQTTFPGVQRARTLVRPPSELGGLLDLPRLEGRLVEISEAGFFGALSAVCELWFQVQQKGEQIAWVATGASVFFPPDLGLRGLDVRALSVVRAPDSMAGLQATDTLLRSGAFGMITVDWTGTSIDEAVLGRLARLAQEQGTSVIFLTRKNDSAPSLGTQVSLRGLVVPGPDGGIECLVSRDKRVGPMSCQRIRFHGPFGLY